MNALRSSRLLLPAALCATLYAAAPKAPPAVPAGRVTGFQAPTSTDPQGRRHVLKVADAQPLTNNVWQTTQPRVTSFNADDTPEMFIEAPRCLYDRQANVATSDSTLSVRRADGRFSIEGTGWRWDPSFAQLTISNEVRAVVLRSALQTNTLSSAARSAETNQPIHITADTFQQDGDNLVFLRHVLVKDGADTLRCDRLNLDFVKPGGIQKLEALQNVVLDQSDTHVTSGRATYEVKENIVRISEHPKWLTANREGSSDVLLLDRASNVITAQGQVYMKLPLTNVVSFSGQNASASQTDNTTNRFIDIYSDAFRYTGGSSNQTAAAFFEKNVRALYSGGTIHCSQMTALFDAQDKVERVIAKHDVILEEGPNKAFGDRADYELASGKVTLTGEPRWTLGERTGRSEKLIFLSKSNETLALGQVQMTLPAQAAANVFDFSRTNQAAGSGTNNSSGPMVIHASTFSHGENVSVFQGAVEVTDARGVLRCETLTVYSGVSNRVERIIAERNVSIKQPSLAAFGDRAEYSTATELVRLTGEPEMFMPDKTLRADAFIIDRRRNTFSVSPGKFNIQLKAKGVAVPARKTRNDVHR